MNFLLRSILLGFAFTVWCLASRFGWSKEVTRVFIFAGQSNMVGADAVAQRIDEYPDYRGAGETQNDVLFSYILGNGDEASNGWVPLQPLRSFGPEITFSRKVKKQVPYPIAIIKSAVGGTTIAFDWNPDAPDKGQKLYPRTLKLIRDSLAELDRRGVHYKLEAVMWHQGENDTYFGPYAQNNATWLKHLIDRVRVSLHQPDLKWFITEQHSKAPWGNIDRVNEALRELARTDANVTVIETSELPHERIHFGTKGTLLLGEEMAEAYLKKP